METNNHIVFYGNDKVIISKRLPCKNYDHYEFYVCKLPKNEKYSSLRGLKQQINNEGGVFSQIKSEIRELSDGWKTIMHKPTKKVRIGVVDFMLYEDESFSNELASKMFDKIDGEAIKFVDKYEPNIINVITNKNVNQFDLYDYIVDASIKISESKQSGIEL